VSVLRPKDGDYISRGIILLWAWTVFGWMPFALIGALLAGAGGATIGFAVAFPMGFILFPAYLKLDPSEHPQRSK
jgi:hypothetical protein